MVTEQERQELYQRLEELYKGAWDASWGANNDDVVYAAYLALLALIERLPKKETE